ITTTADDYETTLRAKIDKQLAQGAKVTLTATRTSTATSTTITGTLTNTSSSTLSNIVINGMIIKDLKESGSRYSVLDIFEEEKILIDSLAPSASLNYTFTINNIKWAVDKLHGVIFVQELTTPEKEVLQAIYVN
ncbi:MAG TPA: hypothetical protein PLT58_07930, partial [Atribacterota bacterium]|nr:hypothetical protein [Atribacterota bacterium]